MFGLLQVLSMVIYVAFVTVYGRHFGFSKIKACLAGVFTLMLDFMCVFLLTWIENGFTNFGAQNAVRAFVFTPLVGYLASLVFKMDYKKLCDCHAPGIVLWFATGHIACIFEGCCQGYQYYEGTKMYDLAQKLTGTNMLPNQLFEVIGAMLVSLILWLMLRKNNYSLNGNGFYIMLVIYGTQRFFFEFLRDNEKVISFREMSSAPGNFGISNLALWAVLMVVVGAVMLATVTYKDKKKAQAEKVEQVA